MLLSKQNMNSVQMMEIQATPCNFPGHHMSEHSIQQVLVAMESSYSHILIIIGFHITNK